MRSVELFRLRPLRDGGEVLSLFPHFGGSDKQEFLPEPVWRESVENSWWKG